MGKPLGSTVHTGLGDGEKADVGCISHSFVDGIK